MSYGRLDYGDGAPDQYTYGPIRVTTDDEIGLLRGDDLVHGSGCTKINMTQFQKDYDEHRKLYGGSPNHNQGLIKDINSLKKLVKSMDLRLTQLEGIVASITARNPQSGKAQRYTKY